MNKEFFRGSFNTVEITPDEEIAGLMYTLAQRKVMQNLKSSYAEEALRVQFAPDKTRQQKDVICARSEGMIAILNYLLHAEEDMQQVSTDTPSSDSSTQGK